MVWDKPKSARLQWNSKEREYFLIKKQFALGRRGAKEEFPLTQWLRSCPDTAAPLGCAGSGRTSFHNERFTSELADTAQHHLAWVSLRQKTITMITRTQFSIPGVTKDLVTTHSLLFCISKCLSYREQMLTDTELLVQRQYCYSNMKYLKESWLQQRFQVSQMIYCIIEAHLGVKVLLLYLSSLLLG